jgi:cysteine desulfurase
MTVYLDHNATSPLLPEVLAVMLPWLGTPGNPASAHVFGQRATVAIEEARAHVAALVGGSAAGVVFTSGATEANHTFLRGHPDVARVAVSGIEHPCVLDAVSRLQCEIAPIGVDADGRMKAVPDADLIIVMAANHETGVIQPVAEVRDAHPDAILHVDATQAAGRIPLSLAAIDSVVLSSHKLGGPGGVGALILRDGSPFPSLIGGGSQERGRRAGTVFTAGVVGFGEACRIALAEISERRSRWAPWSGDIRATVRTLGGEVIGVEVLDNTTCAVFPGIQGESLVQALDLRGVATSAGAACASGSLEASPVLTAMGHAHPDCVLRISLGPRTTSAEVEEGIAALRAIVPMLRPV